MSFHAMGKPVPYLRRVKAESHLREMGLQDTGVMFTLVCRMAEALERDQPSEAMRLGREQLDLTGTYRLMAVLCSD